MSNFASLYGALTAADFLALLDRLLPVHFLEPLRDQPGYELLVAAARLGERLDVALARLDDAAFLLTASIGSRAEVDLQVSRGAVGPALRLLPGTVFEASRSGRRFVATSGVDFGTNDPGPYTLRTQAEAPGEEYNLRGELVTAGGETLPGEIDRIVRAVEDPPGVDLTLRVRQPAEATGGVSGTLEQLGADRGIRRRPDEDPESYRDRVRRLPDTVSPAAIRRALVALLAPYRATGRMLETWEPEVVGCYDAPAASIDPRTFLPDRPAPLAPVVPDTATHRAAMIVRLPQLSALDERGLLLDDPAQSLDDLRSPLGRRALSVPDLPTSDLYSIAVPDAVDAARAAVYQAIIDTLREIAAAGVVIAYALEPTP